MNKKAGNKKSLTPGKTRRNYLLWVIAVLAVITAALALTKNLQFMNIEEKGKSFHLSGKETRPVLDPAMFTGKARAAYAAAQKYPEIMNEMYCYCYCSEPPSNHKTLLSCFVEQHGAG
jgi:hypothetical protein